MAFFFLFFRFAEGKDELLSDVYTWTEVDDIVLEVEAKVPFPFARQAAFY